MRSGDVRVPRRAVSAEWDWGAAVSQRQMPSASSHAAGGKSSGEWRPHVPVAGKAAALSGLNKSAACSSAASIIIAAAVAYAARQADSISAVQASPTNLRSVISNARPIAS